MVNSRILIKGTLDREPKINDNGTVDLILKNYIEDYATKDIKERGESIFLVRLTSRQWARVHKAVKKTNMEISIMGFVKSSINKKGTPFTYISPIVVRVDPIRYIEGEPKRSFKYTTLSKSMKHNSYPKVPWMYKLDDDKFIDLKPDLVELVDDDHINSKIKEVDFNKAQSEDLYIVVRSLDNGKYGLVLGIKKFILGKCLNKSFKAHVTELAREEFLNEFDIEGKHI